jgi:hypothetical protein
MHKAHVQENKNQWATREYLESPDSRACYQPSCIYSISKDFFDIFMLRKSS